MATPSHLYKFQVKMGVKSGIPADAIVNDFHIAFGTSPSGGDITAIQTALEAFYNTTASGASGTLCSRLGDVFDIGSNKMTINTYAIPPSRGISGAPVATTSWTLTSVGGTTLPEEVACVLSLRANVTGVPEFGPGRTTRPAARRRNRIYLGPLSVAVITEDSTTHRPSPSSGFRTDVTKAAAALHAAIIAVSGATWQCFSPTDWEMYECITCWVDDAFDTQRRRGPKAVARTLLNF
jgi:hypothetical protein